MIKNKKWPLPSDRTVQTYKPLECRRYELDSRTVVFKVTSLRPWLSWRDSIVIALVSLYSLYNLAWFLISNFYSSIDETYQTEESFSPVFVVLFSVIWAYFNLKKVHSESITIFNGIGFQLETSRRYNELFPILPSSTIFVSQKNLQDTLILEGFQGFQVHFYLALVCGSIVPTGGEKIIVAFQHLLPPLCVLKPIYWHTQDLLDSA